ncbi:hypothetical protein RND81_06G084600 [Saponaria officinalis]|uniref:Uncharacterized protein n=1 Tax=Saponaria officinalis TaxID=3572 RepID=A0AAW1K4R3_SAPOF
MKVVVVVEMKMVVVVVGVAGRRILSSPFHFSAHKSPTSLSSPHLSLNLPPLHQAYIATTTCRHLHSTRLPTVHRSPLAVPARAPTLAALSHSSPRSATHHHHPSRHHHHHPSPSPPTIRLTDSHRQKSTIDSARRQSPPPKPDAATSLRRHH